MVVNGIHIVGKPHATWSSLPWAAVLKGGMFCGVFAGVALFVYSCLMKLALYWIK